MKHVDGYLLKTVENISYILPYGQNIADHKRGLALNETGTFLWELLKDDLSYETILKKFISHFDATPEESNLLSNDLDIFLKQLYALGLLEETIPYPYEAPYKTLQIGTLSVLLAGEKDYFSPKFDAFESDNSTHPNLIIDVRSGLPRFRKNGTTLLRNKELWVCDCDSEYLLLFPASNHLAEVYLRKDAAYACIYIIPPADDVSNLQEELFHAIRLLYLFLAEQHHVFAIHSASILYKGKAWLFSASSGTGKSTHTNLWKKLFHTPVLNGDLNLISFSHGSPVVYGLPWCGTSEIFTTKSYPLGGIIFLSQAKTNRMESLENNNSQATLSLLQRLISPVWTQSQLNTCVTFSEEMVKSIYTANLHCTKETTAAKVAKNNIDHYERNHYA